MVYVMEQRPGTNVYVPRIGVVAIVTNVGVNTRRMRVVSPMGRFIGSFRPGSFRPCFKDGSIRP